MAREKRNASRRVSLRRVDEQYEPAQVVIRDPRGSGEGRSHRSQVPLLPPGFENPLPEQNLLPALLSGFSETEFCGWRDQCLLHFDVSGVHDVHSQIQIALDCFRERAVVWLYYRELAVHHGRAIPVREFGTLIAELELDFSDQYCPDRLSLHRVWSLTSDLSPPAHHLERSLDIALRFN